jgi:hypothetical protein
MDAEGSLRAKLEKKSVDQLRRKRELKGIEKLYKYKKAQLIDMIIEAQMMNEGYQTLTGGKPKRKSGKKGTDSVSRKGKRVKAPSQEHVEIINSEERLEQEIPFEKGTSDGSGKVEFIDGVKVEEETSWKVIKKGSRGSAAGESVFRGHVAIHFGFYENEYDSDSEDPDEKFKDNITFPKKVKKVMVHMPWWKEEVVIPMMVDDVQSKSMNSMLNI